MLVNPILENRIGKYAPVKLGIIFFFFLIYASISIVNHYLFRTAAYDLGIYNNAIYSYAHFSMNYTPIQHPEVHHILSDHFEPVLFLFSPLYWIFGTYTLLWVQILLIIAGGIGMMKFVRVYTQNEKLAVFALAHFYTIWGIYSALAFDFHNNITAAMMVPWLMYYFHQRKWKGAILFFVLMLISKENMALYASFVALGLALFYWKEKVSRNMGLMLFGVGIMYFVVMVQWVIPSFVTGEQKYIYTKMYAALGNTKGEIIQTLLTRPLYLMQLIFQNHLGDAQYDGIKAELHYMILISGGILMLYRPAFIVMLIPIYAQKLFISDYTRWGINYHYSIEFVPIICTASFVAIAAIKKEKWQLVAAGIVVAASLFANIQKMDRRVSLWYNREHIRFYQKGHYQQSFDVKAMHHHIQTVIPAKAKVSASSPLCPHLAMRETIYQYPYVNDADYIALMPSCSGYPLRPEELAQHVLDLKSDTTKTVVFDDGELVVFKVK
ncbi:MAG: DUF2079 domain-containing protein [Bacteroidota bacterium]